MIEIGGIEYYIDLDNLDKVITSKTNKGKTVIDVETRTIVDSEGKIISTEIIKKEYERPREINMAKYETVRSLIDIILSTLDEIDDELGIDRALGDLPLPFKLSFNTLIGHGIINERK